jgi:hypothetical protein
MPRGDACAKPLAIARRSRGGSPIEAHMSAMDENDRLRAGQLPVDPEDDAVPMLSGDPWDEPIPF